jgi:integrase
MCAIARAVRSACIALGGTVALGRPTQREPKRASCWGLSPGGNDPFPDEVAGEGLTLGTLFDRYLERKRASLKPRSFSEVQRYLKGKGAPLTKLELDQMNRRVIAELLGSVQSANGPVARNRFRSSLSGFFAWCVTEGLLENNPVQGTATADEGGSRERVLAKDELLKLLPMLTGEFGDVVRLLLLTGQRRNEIGKLKWSETDAKRGMIVLAPARTKNKRRHELPLSTQALAILARRPRRNSSAFVFGSTQSQGWSNWSRAKADLDQRARIADWTLHDLRRTCATGMAELGVQPHIIEAVLNHVSGHKAGVAGIYNRAKYEGEMRSALQRWADHVDEITG